MITCDQVAAWHGAVTEEFRDPSVPITQLFAKWSQSTIDWRLVMVGEHRGEFALYLGHEFPILPLRIQTGGPTVNDAGELEAFGATRVTNGVWSLNPSLNAEGLIHAFLVLYDVPDPAPWERRIVLAGA